MNPHYNQNYTRDEVSQILQTIQKCVRKGHFEISKNNKRIENTELIRNYNVNPKKQKKILLNLKVEDFCHSVQNKKQGYQHETLYVFCPQVGLYDVLGMRNEVDIYIKFNILQLNPRKQVIVISFHQRNKPIDYLFR